eukprot:c7329_g1_i1.p1 GENE.c7329_g1_i1~~c7329_g1_i1.p1  ORF type:complete len:217 (-),score=36.30 c7329_g1_i1:29-640(-)
MSTASAPVNSDLDLFQKEILGFGSLRGFVHFSTYLRGREELLLTVFNYTDGYKRPEDCTDFLVGCYARYQKPFVWIRTSDENRKRVFGHQGKDRDIPLDLDSTDKRREKMARMAEIVSEIVMRNTATRIVHPFEINHEEISQLDCLHRVLASAALIQFLKSIYVDANNPNAQHVQKDLQQLVETHFQNIEKILSSSDATDSMQ